ncbi:MAG: Fe-S protein assembly co-chaperone HscB [Burkholderiaceae bacterium]|jgi:molecular chaperone HscB
MDISQSHFALFGLPERFEIDRQALDGAYRRVLSEVHPDRFASAGDTERRIALQWSTQANGAYRTLKDDVARASYLSELRGIALDVESNTYMAPDFLMEQLEWREALEAAQDEGDVAALEGLYERLVARRTEALREIGMLFDEAGDADTIAQAVRKLMFLQKFAEDIEDALEGIRSH